MPERCLSDLALSPSPGPIHREEKINYHNVQKVFFSPLRFYGFRRGDFLCSKIFDFSIVKCPRALMCDRRQPAVSSVWNGMDSLCLGTKSETRVPNVQQLLGVEPFECSSRKVCRAYNGIFGKKRFPKNGRGRDF